MLACLGLSAGLPGLCAAAVPDDSAGSHAAHGAHRAQGEQHAVAHAAGAARSAHAPHLAKPGATRAEKDPAGGHHHDDCALMVRCHWTALASPAVPVAFVAPHATDAMPAMYTTRTAPIGVIDTPPPRTIS